jgi:[ribosomal protein S5]-alanine N-acetyltransferase
LWFFRNLWRGPVLIGNRIMVRPPVMDDFKQWSALRQESRNFLEPWEPTWNEDEFKRGAFRRRLSIYHDWAARDHGYAFFIFETNTNQLVGAISLSHFRRGAEQSATLGYWIGMKFAMQGYMTEALNLIINHAFGTMGLHRVEAACLPRNAASKKLLESCGFKQEGYAPSYIKIAGRWEDHLLFARLKTVN